LVDAAHGVIKQLTVAADHDNVGIATHCAEVSFGLGRHDPSIDAEAQRILRTLSDLTGFLRPSQSSAQPLPATLGPKRSVGNLRHRELTRRHMRSENRVQQVVGHTGSQILLGVAFNERSKECDQLRPVW
jgi:hypothetical protein